MGSFDPEKSMNIAKIMLIITIVFGCLWLIAAIFPAFWLINILVIIAETENPLLGLFLLNMIVYGLPLATASSGIVTLAFFLYGHLNKEGVKMTPKGKVANMANQNERFFGPGFAGIIIIAVAMIVAGVWILVSFAEEFPVGSNGAMLVQLAGFGLAFGSAAPILVYVLRKLFKD